MTHKQAVIWVRKNCRFAASPPKWRDIPPPPRPPWKQPLPTKPPISTGTPGTAPAPTQEWKPNYGVWGKEKALRDRLKIINQAKDPTINGMFEAALKRGMEAAHKFLLQYESQG